MPKINLPPSSGTSDAAYSPLCGTTGVEALRSPATLQSILPITPRVALAQADIVSCLLPGNIEQFSGGGRVVATNAITSWSDLTTGFTVAFWLKATAAGNSDAVLFSTWAGGAPPPGAPTDPVVWRKNAGTSNFRFEYQSGGGNVVRATTDQNPWNAGTWHHFAVSYTSARTLTMYKDGVLLRFDVNIDTGGTTPSNVTTHTFNTPIPAAARHAGYLFGGGPTKAHDSLGGEVFNGGYWDKGLIGAEIAVLAGDSKLDLAVNSGAYVSSSNLKFNPKFSVLDASGSYGVAPPYGLDSYSNPVGPSVP